MTAGGSNGSGEASGAGLSVVIAHDFAETYGGAERIIATAGAVLPDSQMWAIAGRGSVGERMGFGGRFHTVLPERDLLLRHYRSLAPLYPAIVRARALPAADVLLSSSYAFAHGFRTENDAPHLCYSYSPLRFAWSMTGDYSWRLAAGPRRRRAFEVFASAMRRADRRASERVDHYIAESHHVAKQIKLAFGRSAEVIHPPVDTGLFRPAAEGDHDDYYLFCGRLVEPYKRPGIVIEAFRSRPERLIVAGDGPAYRELKRRASANVEFVGQVDDSELVPLMQRCAACVFPSVDDFGLIPVEVMACGRPVLAFSGGGALETVLAGETGEFFSEPTAPALAQALSSFEPNSYDAARIRTHAEQWAAPRFQQAILRAIARVVGSQPAPR